MKERMKLKVSELKELRKLRERKQEAASVISEGGLAGHMNHLYDNRGLTFGKMKEIFQAAASGKLVGAEKTDGQNLFISYSVPERKAKAARNKGNIKSGGMDAVALAQKFAGRGGLTEAFVESFAAFEEVISQLPVEEQIKIFGPDADIFYNAEVMDPRSANVINYDKKSLVIHREGHAKFDKETAKVEDVDVSQNAAALEAALQKLEQSDKEYQVVMKSLAPLKAISDGKVLEFALSRLGKFMQQNEMSDDNTVGDYVARSLSGVISKAGIELPEDRKSLLVRKLYGEKGTKITDVTKGLPKEEAAAVKSLYKDLKKIMAKIIFPLEDIVHDFSVEILRGMNSAFVLSNKEEVERIRGQVANAIKQIEASDSEEVHQFLGKQLSKLKDIKNVSTAVEGIVFQYDGVTYKLTGNFAPINQILGFFKYGGRGSVKEAIGAEERKVYFVFGRMNPPTPGHLIMLEEGKKMADAAGADFRVFLSKSQDAKKNPLPYQTKIKFFKAIFPDYAPYLVEAEEMRTVIDILKGLDSNYTDVTMLVGEDRVESFSNLLNKYNGKEYEYNNISVQNTGGRAEGRSATAMRNLAKQNDLEGFVSSYPNVSNKEVLTSLFSALRDSMMLKESVDYDSEDAIATAIDKAEPELPVVAIPASEEADVDAELEMIDKIEDELPADIDRMLAVAAQPEELSLKEVIKGLLREAIPERGGMEAQAVVARSLNLKELGDSNLLAVVNKKGSQAPDITVFTTKGLSPEGMEAIIGTPDVSSYDYQGVNYSAIPKDNIVAKLEVKSAKSKKEKSGKVTADVSFFDQTVGVGQLGGGSGEEKYFGEALQLIAKKKNIEFYKKSGEGFKKITNPGELDKLFENPSMMLDVMIRQGRIGEEKCGSYGNLQAPPPESFTYYPYPGADNIFSACAPVQTERGIAFKITEGGYKGAGGNKFSLYFYKMSTNKKGDSVKYFFKMSADKVGDAFALNKDPTVGKTKLRAATDSGALARNCFSVDFDTDAKAVAPADKAIRQSIMAGLGRHFAEGGDDYFVIADASSGYEDYYLFSTPQGEDPLGFNVPRLSGEYLKQAYFGTYGSADVGQVRAKLAAKLVLPQELNENMSKKIEEQGKVHIDEPGNVQMLKNKLIQIQNSAKMMATMLDGVQEDSDLPVWWQAKVTSSGEKLSSAADYLESTLIQIQNGIDGPDSTTLSEPRPSEDNIPITLEESELSLLSKLAEEEKKKDDRCTRIAKRKYDKWPSAYASGAVVQCRKGKIWKGLKEVEDLTDMTPGEFKSSLHDLEQELVGVADLTSIERAEIYNLLKKMSDVAVSGTGNQFASLASRIDQLKASLEGEMDQDESPLAEKKTQKTDYSKEKKSGLHGWFQRQGGKGSSQGWVDCNTCRKDPKTGRKKCKSCGRGEGEKRSKYPSCRPTPASCGTPGKGKKWGKTKKK